MPLPRRLATFNRLATNRVIEPFAGRVPGFAVVVHKGRKSGREYRCPVGAVQDEVGFKIPLPYGRDVDWVKNVLAEGGCELVIRGDSVHVVDPEVIHDGDISWTPIGVRHMLKALDAPYYLQVRRAE
ncbi:nitroreductase family deazaflavin-dependent oxidoreductase [Antrihabitans stalactiti]|uniref:Nitroreductase family deazaflavin-dependent oxidoreductase n=1 Tax=Antrihabitans stalactiti TaxID=2584121 RepID=A0A848KLJ2_9NOCA|nr:nitroreductase family deazaflavin-dependent oxidoreductase [Antrihabitans stalactiti]NMN98706.1 nitroreductase family deazaflavin-dependent oxidoreductase [Antrihabitans stalactiti]